MPQGKDMQYYILQNSTGDDIGDIQGIQLKSRSNEYLYNEPDSYQYLPDLAPAKMPPNLNYFLVERKAIMTDFISCKGIINATGFTISERARLIFEHIKLMPYSLYPIRLLHKNTFYNYYWMHLEKDFIEYIDFEKSEFSTKRMPFTEILHWDYQTAKITPHSARELTRIRRENYGKEICIDRLFLNKNFDDQLNLFCFSSVNYGVVLISDSLKRILELERISGIDVMQPTYPIHLAE
jgi:hypothetical protein